MSIKTDKMIWGRSGNICAFPECRKFLVVDKTATDDPSLIGEEAHIVGKSKDGPRGKSDLGADQRDKYENLILLCAVHHKIVDDQENEYTVEKLHQFKNNHEHWVKESLITNSRKIKDDELYATYIEKFISLTDLHNWNNWTSWILGSTEIFPKTQFDSLKTLPDYIISRLWPEGYDSLRTSLINFKNVVNDLMRVFNEYLDVRADGYCIEKFYHDYYPDKCLRSGRVYSMENENLAFQRYEYHIALVDDLILELTRAANYVCDQIRIHIFEGFRMEEGALLVTRADFLSAKTYRVEYRGAERIGSPYPGLRTFMAQRESRDMHFGKGIEESYFLNIP